MTKSIAASLAKAQSEMSNAAKDAENPHFKKPYADLASVRAACLPALNSNGFAVIQPIVGEGDDIGVKTILMHESGEQIECTIPLVLAKRDMQGLGSAITYARRYGLMAMAGVAPDDDDGNAAVANGEAPGRQNPAIERDRIKKSIAREGDIESLGAMWKAEWQNIKALPEPMQAELTKDKDDRKLAIQPPTNGAALDGDEIPY